MRTRAWKRTSAVGLAVLVTAAVAGCGGSGSTTTTAAKPAYCGNIQALTKGVNSLDISAGVRGVEKQLAQLETNATAVVNSAKSDFSSQIAAVQSSLQKLKTQVQAASSNPSASAIAAATVAGKNVATSVSELAAAAKSKCQ